MQSLRILFILLLTITFTINVGQSAVLNVPEDFESIGDAIDETEEGDTVLVHPGEYEENLNIPERDLTIASLILTTGNAAYIDSTIINGGGDASVITLDGVRDDVIITGFTITNGAGQFGAGINCIGSSPTLRHLRVTECGNGNTWRGGGIYILEGSEPVLEYIDFTNNTASFGGAIAIANCAATFDHLLIANNQAAAEGGGVYMNQGEITFTNSTFTQNQCNRGSNINFLGTSVTLINCISWNNPDVEVFGFMGRVIFEFSDIEGGRNGAGPVNNVTFGNDCINDDPEFVDADENNYYLTEDSPCIDTGDPDSPDDPDRTRADMGAYYFNQLGDPPVIVVTPEVINFGGALVEDTLTAEITISNQGEGELVVFSVEVDNGNFITSFGEEINVQPSDSTILQIYFTPQESGDMEGVITITSNDLENEEVTVTLTGTAVESGGFVLNVPDDYETIQSAILAAVDEDTVLVAPGEYVENINFTGKAIVVMGNIEDPSATVIDGGGVGSVVTFNQEEPETAALTGLTIKNGSASFGGGIYIQNGHPTLSNLILMANSADSTGGAIFVANSHTTLSNVTIDSCFAPVGAGISIWNAQADMNHLLISGNVCTKGASALYMMTATVSIDHTTIVQNDGGDLQGGIISCSGSDLEILNSIIAGNTPTDSMIFLDGGSANISYSDIENGQESIESIEAEVVWGNGNIDADPLFVDFDGRDLHLTENSPCIDAGNPDSEYDSDSTITDMGMYCFFQIIDDVEEGKIGLVSDFNLEKPYPNPFNSTSKISFNLSKSSSVNLSVFDISGRNVITLLNSVQPAGRYTTSLRANNLSTGLYLIKLTTPNGVKTQKLALVK